MKTMKKKYIRPAIGNEGMEGHRLLVASVNHVDKQEAAAGSSESTVNLGRSNGSFWDEEN